MGFFHRTPLSEEVDGSRGRFRAPRNTCKIKASNDYEAVQAWIALHDAPATQRAYRKEAERLILWAIIERKQALSSLTTDDAIYGLPRILASSHAAIALGWTIATP